MLSHPFVAHALNALATPHYRRGDYAGALELRERGLAILRVTDGEPCERFAVEVGFVVEALFAGVVGIDSLPTGARAVARATPAWLRQAPNLWLLDPTGCTALSVQGGSQVTVGNGAAEPLVKGQSFMTLFNAHVHNCTAPGAPSGPPITPLTPAMMTTATKGA